MLSMRCPLVYQITSPRSPLLTTRRVFSLCAPAAACPPPPPPDTPVRRRVCAARDVDVGNEGAGSSLDTETERITSEAFFFLLSGR